MEWILRLRIRVSAPQYECGTTREHSFSGSVADNIRLCKPQASDEEIRHAAQLAGALAFIEGLPHGFNQ